MLAHRLLGAVDAARVLAGGELRSSGAVVLAYHDVGHDVGDPSDYAVTPRTLARHLDEASRWGLRFVALDELSRRIAGGVPIDGLASVAFDDALVGVHRHAAAALAERNVPGTVFVVSRALGAEPAWWPSACRTMDERELGELIEAGWTVGSHGRSHRSLPSLSDQQLDDELAGAKRDLEDVSGSTVDLLAYPFGHHDRRVRDAARLAGYTAAYTFTNGRILADTDRYRLPRLTMSERHGTPRLAYHLARSARSWPAHDEPHRNGHRTP